MKCVSCDFESPDQFCRLCAEEHPILGHKLHLDGIVAERNRSLPATKPCDGGGGCSTCGDRCRGKPKTTGAYGSAVWHTGCYDPDKWRVVADNTPGAVWNPQIARWIKPA